MKEKKNKEKKKKEYKLKLKRSRIFEFLKSVFRIIKHRPKIVNLSGAPLSDQAIYLSNHAGANGPLSYELFFPKRLTGWGIYRMFEGFRGRWDYLYHTFYRQKLHWGKFKSFVVATLFAPISRSCYNAIGLIPTYTDSRFIGSLKISCRILDENSALLIFPEDSSKGYSDPPPAFNEGFVAMAKTYYKRRKIDVPVYNVYFSPKVRKMIVSEPIYVNKMLAEGYTSEQIAAAALAINHRLYHDYVENGSKKQQVPDALFTSDVAPDVQARALAAALQQEKATEHITQEESQPQEETQPQEED